MSFSCLSFLAQERTNVKSVVTCTSATSTNAYGTHKPSTNKGIREQEEQLKQIMIYAGRPGLWGDWQRFQAKARVARREAEEARKRKNKQIIEWTIIIAFGFLFLGILGSIVALILHHQGRL
jgi:preprotein translocase subunit Sss1